MAYITVSNSKKLLKKLDLTRFEKFQAQIYKKDIYFFSTKERLILAGIRELLRDPENFVAEFYDPIIIVDSLKYVFEEQQPAYHYDHTCERLHSNFMNFEIPEDIQNQGQEKVKEFRKWFKENPQFLNDLEVYEMRLYAKYGIHTNLKRIDYHNSGVEDFANLNLQELEAKIDDVLKQAGKYFRDNPEKQSLIKRYGKLTFLAYVNNNIYNNDSGLSDKDLKEFLKYYDQTFKQPVRELLIHYYRVLYNPNMTFEGNLLEKLNFRKCATCHKTDKIGINELFPNSNTEKKEIIEIINSNLDFFITLLSVHYPFSKEEIILHKDKLKWGGGFYSFWEGETIYGVPSPTPGLCFNKAIVWDDKLLQIAKFEMDHYSGTAFNEKNLPLDIAKELELRENIGRTAMLDCYQETYGHLPEELVLDQMLDIYDINWEKFQEDYNRIFKELNLEQLNESITNCSFTIYYNISFFNSVINLFNNHNIHIISFLLRSKIATLETT